MSVKIIENLENEPLAQEIDEMVVSIGFTKLDSGREYFLLIEELSSLLWEQHLKDNKILSNYSRQLGDIFNEYEWDDNQ